MKKFEVQLLRVLIGLIFLTFFAFTLSSQEKIKVMKPDGGETYYVGWKQNIFWQTWDKSNKPTNNGKVTIEYSSDGGASWHKIVKDYPNSKGYLWTVPNVISSNCRIKIKWEWKATEGNVQINKVTEDVTDGVFTITNPPTVNVRIIRPNGGERMSAGSLAGIKWEVKLNNSPCYEGKSSLYYSIDNGTNWNLIARDLKIDSRVGVGAYTWQVPHVSSTRCKLKVVWSKVGMWRDETLTGSDETDNVFTISIQ